MFDSDAKRAAIQIREASDRLRGLARKATPGVWAANTDDGLVRVIGRDGWEVARLSGPWAANTASYVAALGPNTAYMVAEVMWLSEPLVRRGELPSRLRAQLQALAQVLPD